MSISGNPDVLFAIYLRSYGKVLSGSPLTASDYVTSAGGSFMGPTETTAVTLGVKDAKEGGPLKKKSEFIGYVDMLISG